MQKDSKPDIFIISTNNWNGFWFQRQEFACRFAQEGYRVFYINKIPQRIPSFKSLIRFIKTKIQNDTIKNDIPKNVIVLTPFFLPPLFIFKVINYVFALLFVYSIKSKFKIKNLFFITYQPSYIVLHMISQLKPDKIIYVNTHNYNSDPTCPKILFQSEQILVSLSHVLLADSLYNQKRLEKCNPSIPVGRAMPGVNISHFLRSYRGDEIERKKTIYFFGDIGKHLDIELYNKAAEEFKVYLIGIINNEIAHLISSKITILPPVSPSNLPDILRGADILTIWYKKSDYVDGILPAKFFECLATQKPLFISGLNEALLYSDAVYNIDGSYIHFKEIIRNLENLETIEKREKRIRYAKEADWSVRYNQFKSNIGIC
ncbi:MAG: glycosyltransferase family 1 protein [Bacteroidales bacterium]|nr:glycosyltransferase family 1 protein [Bacteroidales bacterium]